MVLMEALYHQKKKVCINFTTANKKLFLNLHDNADNSYLFATGKEIFKFKAGNKNVNFPTHVSLRSIFNGFSNTSLEK